MQSKKYIAYINSFAWYLKRRAAIARVGEQCQRCPATDGLEVHHLTYERLGEELDTDLLVVCEPCHKREDEKRQKETVARQRQALYAARLNGWATRKYGENWREYNDYSEVEEAFDAWLEWKGYE